MPAAEVILQLQSQAAPEIRRTAAETKALAAEEEKAQRASLARAQAVARLQAANGQLAQAEQTLAQAIARTGTENIAAIRAETQRIGILNRMSAEEARAAQAATTAAAAQRQQMDALRASLTPVADAAGQTRQGFDAMGQGLTGLIGPAALATAALTAVHAVVTTAEEGFRLRAALDQEQGAIAIQLRGLRDSGATFQAASAFAERYRFTQEQITQATADSLPVLRRSHSSISDVLGVFSRLTILKPDKTFNDAARALSELQGGQVESLHKVFNVTSDDANRMKHEIEGGADAVQVLSQYLTNAGVGMDALENRTKGATGKMHELEQASEGLKLALGDDATGPGLAILNARIAVTRDATRLLRGDMTGANDAIRDSGIAAFNPLVDLLNRYNSAVLGAGRGALEWAGVMQGSTPPTQQQTQATELLGLTQEQAAQNTRILAGEQAHLRDEHLQTGQIVQQTSAQVQEFNASLQQNAVQSQISAAQSTILKQQQENVARSALLASQGMLGEGDQALLLAQKLGIAKDQAQLLINANQVLAGQAAFAAQRAEEQGRLPDDVLKSRTRARDAADKLHQQFVSDEAQKQKQIADAQRTLDLSRARTPAQRIAIYQRELAATTDIAERLRIQAQIESEKNSAAKSHVATLDKTLNLEEKIRDSKEAQYKASLDAQEAAIRDRQETRKEDQELRTHQNALRNARDPRLRAAAADAIALIGVHRQQRALDIQEKGATAGGAIIGGRLYQSQAGQGVPGAPSLPAAPGVPQAGGAQAPAAAGGAPTVLQINLDGQKIAEVTLPYTLAALRGSRRQATAAG